jgi:hypothetical protein
LKKTKKNSKKQGLKYYRKKQYIRAVSCFEKALKENKNDHEIYLYLGYASVFTDDLDGALNYFRRGLLVAEDNTELLKGLAYCYLKNERIEDAISKWGEVLEKNPGDRFARKAIERLRASGDIDNFIENASPKDFFSGKLPLSEKIKPYILGFSITFGIVIIFVIFYTTPLYKNTLHKFYPEVSTLNKISFPEEGPIILDNSEEALYSFSEKEIESSFVKVKKSIYKNEINNAVILLNKIMLSNASPVVKEKFEILYKFIDPPDPLSIDYNPRYYEILKEPAAFKGVYVLWTGRIANLQVDDKSVQFDLLVNYENEDTVDGIAHISIYGTYYIENRQKVEIFGSFDGYDTESGKLLIDGIFLRDLKLPDTST